MSLLIQLKQRIKAIQTTKKITHAMRLISMSTHSRLKKKQDVLSNYMQELEKLLNRIYPHIDKNQHPILFPPHQYETNPLVILVGSQKGLCGNFNTSLFHTFNQHMIIHASKPVRVLAIGKKAVNYVKRNGLTPTKIFNEFTFRTLYPIAKNITETIMFPSHSYSSVVVISNTFKRFFTQQPRVSTLIPFVHKAKISESTAEEYMWGQNPQEIIAMVIQQYIEAHIQYLLFQSLLAEQAARFISMDNATRSAQTLLENTTLQYNKLRQAKITKELTELSSIF